MEIAATQTNSKPAEKSSVENDLETAAKFETVGGDREFYEAVFGGDFPAMG